MGSEGFRRRNEALLIMRCFRATPPSCRQRNPIPRRCMWSLWIAPHPQSFERPLSSSQEELKYMSE